MVPRYTHYPDVPENLAGGIPKCRRKCRMVVSTKEAMDYLRGFDACYRNLYVDRNRLLLCKGLIMWDWIEKIGFTFLFFLGLFFVGAYLISILFGLWLPAIAFGVGLLCLLMLVHVDIDRGDRDAKPEQPLV